MQAIERPKSLTEIVTETLRDWVIGGELELGSHLSEARIAKTLKVSRTPVREAINRLEIEGLLTVEPQRGTFVFAVEPEELSQLCGARLCLETTALADAARLDRKALCAGLSAVTLAMAAAREAGDTAGYLALDTRFHQVVFDHCGNRFLNDAYQMIAPKMAALRNRLGRHPAHMEKSYREHCRIAEAVEAGDDDRALRVLKGHIGLAEGSYWKDLGEARELTDQTV